MPYFHDEPNQTVYFVPPEPVALPRNIGRERAGWTVTATVDVASASNYFERPNYWAKPTSLPLTEHYEPRYSEQEAVRAFKARHLNSFGTGMKVITREEYEVLKAAYESQARDNRPPKD